MNVASPSVERAERQLAWLATREEPIFVLTETSAGAGSRLLAARMRGSGWDVRYPLPTDGERGVLIASRLALATRADDFLGYLPARAEAVHLGDDGPRVIGLYVPSRDESTIKIERKQRFLKEILAALGSQTGGPTVLIGDFNILEPSHRPRYRFFGDWEYGFYESLIAAGWIDAYRDRNPDSMDYSWVGRDEDGYRFDHIFVSGDLAEKVTSCEYLHETRMTDLTDHSAMRVELALDPPGDLNVDRSLSGEHMSLF